MTLQTRRVGEYIVSEAGPLEAARIMRLSAKYQEMVSAAQAKGDAADEDDLERLQALSLWPPIAACVTPLISAEDWLQIPLTMIQELKTQAEILNPGWFAPLTPEKEKKTKQRHKKPMNA